MRKDAVIWLVRWGWIAPATTSSHASRLSAGVANNEANTPTS